jgi:hypothetical protein
MIILGLYILSVLLNVFVLMPLCVKAFGSNIDGFNYAICFLGPITNLIFPILALMQYAEKLSSKNFSNFFITKFINKIWKL